jgi:hypothetical protein
MDDKMNGRLFLTGIQFIYQLFHASISAGLEATAGAV